MSSIEIERFISNPNVENTARVVSYIKNEYNAEIIAELATALASSGICLSSNTQNADIPSTGGPSSLSTLLCPLILKEQGFNIPKLGIVGRPAGGIDILYQIDGYKVDFSVSEIESCIETNSYCHFLVGAAFAPLDLILFDYRANNNKKDFPPLVIASILSKKIAAGVKKVGLDIRIGEFGNFGSNINDATKNARLFIDTAKNLGMEAVCFLNDFTSIQQPYIGRGEALVALNNIFNSGGCYLLNDHLHRCIDMAISLGGNKSEIKTIITSLKQNFESNLEAQMTTMDKFHKKVREVQLQHIYTLEADCDGYLKINLSLLRDALTWGQSLHLEKSRFPDNCGVIFKKNSNEFVCSGETLLTFRSEGIDPLILKDLLTKSISIQSHYEECSQYKKIYNE